MVCNNNDPSLFCISICKARYCCCAKTEVIPDLESRIGTLVCFKMDCTDGWMKRELMGYKLYQPSMRNRKLTKWKNRPVTKVIYSSSQYLQYVQCREMVSTPIGLFQFYDVEFSGCKFWIQMNKASVMSDFKNCCRLTQSDYNIHGCISIHPHKSVCSRGTLMASA